MKSTSTSTRQGNASSKISRLACHFTLTIRADTRGTTERNDSGHPCVSRDASMRESNSIFSAGCRSIGIALSFGSGSPCFTWDQTYVLSLTVKPIREACHCEVKVPSVVQAPVNPRADFALVLRDVCFLQGLISFDPALILWTEGGGFLHTKLRHHTRV